MENLDFIKQRRSIRRFKNIMPSDAQILSLLECASYAPSSTNTQPWQFLVIKNRDIIEEISAKVELKLQEMYKIIKNNEDKEFLKDFSKYYTLFKDAPVIISFFYKPYKSILDLFFKKNGVETGLNEANGIDQSAISVAAAIENFLLAAYILGLGTCWMTSPLIAKDDIEKMLNISEPWHLLSIVALGYPDEVPPMPRRKDLSLVAKFIE